MGPYACIRTFYWAKHCLCLHHTCNFVLDTGVFLPIFEVKVVISYHSSRKIATSILLEGLRRGYRYTEIVCAIDQLLEMLNGFFGLEFPQTRVGYHRSYCYYVQELQGVHCQLYLLTMDKLMSVELDTMQPIDRG